MKILDAGCGNNKTEGAVVVDINPYTQADVIYDLNNFPWPFKNDTFDEIICSDVLEHLKDIIPAMEEIHRIGKSNAAVKIRVPHFSNNNAYGDITHKHFFNTQSFDCFLGSNLKSRHYSNACFDKVNMAIKFPKLHWFVRFFANKYPVRYERYFAFIFQAGNIEFSLRIIK